MRDRNLTLNQFNIQLTKALHQSFLLDDKFLTRPVFVTPTRLSDCNQVRIVYPKEFRLLRILCISQWYFPEELHWRVFLDLKDFSFSWLNEKQKLELNVYLSSKENMEKYLFLTERYTAGEIFGNILRNDMRDLEKELKFYSVKLPRPRKAIRRRGYKDKGSRRPDHQWLPRFDLELTRIQNDKEKKTNLLQKTIHSLLLILENYDLRS